jgi:hypothetical protein
MIIAETSRSRRLVGRLDRGVDLFGAILDVCKQRGVRSAEVRALGSLEAVELAEYDQAARKWKVPRRYTGGFEVCQLLGNVSEKDGELVVHAHATLMRDTDNGVQLLGGHVVSGRVFALEIVVDTWDDLVLRRGIDEATGLTQWCEVAPEGTPTAIAPPPTPPGPSWEDVAKVSAAQPPPEPAVVEGPGADEPLAPGDTILHPKFGRCEVLRIEGAHEYARVRLVNGNMIRLSLEVLDLDLEKRDGKKRIFRAKLD